MNKFRLLTILLGLAFTGLPFSTHASLSDRKYETPSYTRKEVQGFMRLLQEYHYNRDAVSEKDYAPLIQDYMAELDPTRLFFTAEDKTSFIKRYPGILYTLEDLGNLDAAFDMYSLYERRAEERINWVFEELKKDIDINSRDSYILDRS